MRYAIGFFGGSVCAVGPAKFVDMSTPFTNICKAELYRGKGLALLHVFVASYVSDYPEDFDHVMRKKSMVNLPWRIYGGGK